MVACASCPALHFPLASPPTAKMIERGYQTPLGFLFDHNSFKVEAVEPGSAAASAELQPKDIIVEVNGKDTHQLRDIVPIDGVLQLTVIRDDKSEILRPFEPRSIGLNPTQVYETLIMGLLLFFLLPYYPYKRHDVQLM